MTAVAEKQWNRWRIARWSVAAALLLLPLAMMQVNDEWNWGVGDFVFAGVMICGTCMLYETAAKWSGSLAYRGGVVLALAASFLIVWINLAVGIVGEDSPFNVNFFGLVAMAAAVSFASGFTAKGMARGMACVAAATAFLGVLLATAPMNADVPPGPARLLGISLAFAAVWLASAALFGRAAKAERTKAASTNA
jgi:hypothetical protein